MTPTDPDLDTLLSDPLIRSVMKADRVDPERLRSKLVRIGTEIAERRHGRSRDRLGDCVQARFAAERKAAAAPAGGIW
jgi:hypothetical protein